MPMHKIMKLPKYSKNAEIASAILNQGGEDI